MERRNHLPRVLRTILQKCSIVLKDRRTDIEPVAASSAPGASIPHSVSCPSVTALASSNVVPRGAASRRAASRAAPVVSDLIESISDDKDKDGSALWPTGSVRSWDDTTDVADMSESCGTFNEFLHHNPLARSDPTGSGEGILTVERQAQERLMRMERRNGTVFSTDDVGIADSYSCTTVHFGDEGMGMIERHLAEDGIDFEWRKGGLLGAGSYAHVFLGLNCSTGELLAVKQAPLPADQDELTNEIRMLSREISFLKQLSHPNIVEFRGMQVEKEMLNVFLEYVSGGSLLYMLKKFGTLPEQVVASYTRQIVKGLEYLHANGIVHRDVKGANCLVSPSGTVKLADFGTAKRLMSKVSSAGQCGSLKGTVCWMAPEIVRQEPSTFQSDIWSLGCTVVEMITGHPPFAELEQMAALFKIAKLIAPPPLPSGVSGGCREFLNHCFAIRAEERWTASQLLEHSWLVSGGPARRRYSCCEAPQTTHRGRGSSLCLSSSTVELGMASDDE